MLTDMIVEEEFELKDEEPWYGKQDLEHGKRLVLRALKGGIAWLRPKQPQLRGNNHQPPIAIRLHYSTVI